MRVPTEGTAVGGCVLDGAGPEGEIAASTANRSEACRGASVSD